MSVKVKGERRKGRERSKRIRDLVELSESLIYLTPNSLSSPPPFSPSPRTQIYEEFGDIADSIGLPKDQYTQKFKLDTSNGQKNGGNGVTRVMKFYVKQHRQLGVHVTPTIRVNGLLCDSSSGWTLEVCEGKGGRGKERGVILISSSLSSSFFFF